MLALGLLEQDLPDPVDIMKKDPPYFAMRQLCILILVLASMNPDKQLDETDKQFLKDQGLAAEIESKRSVMELQKQ